jgi:hypothetical protein
VVIMLDAVSRYGGACRLQRANSALSASAGGGQSFHYATVQPDLGAAVVYYGTSPAGALGAVRAPVLGSTARMMRANTTVGPAATK